MSMNVLSFEVQSDDNSVWIMPVIDGVCLADLITAFEHANNYTDPAGGYGHIREIDFKPLGNDIDILACECGETGCWPLKATAFIENATVVWSAFRQPFRKNRNYDAFGPFRFSRSHFDTAISHLRTDITPKD
ncbi:hypothetical protein PQU92_00225 [Asticcacaulis sp. BYS171W]|uniref:Uncharacterized protein n=1 Tax=Asticcacaulis aquaticus TaxID=2984212 RepID=A0ABT5HNR2_9CAUL|nr:hypothetical protein [Asticcacaulis aquaticus]MDC7681689.1 hypothetical protein [Asticcacaulis aquaticus]